MGGSRFDAWTRRRLELTAGGAAALVVSLIGLGYAEATRKRKNKRRKKRCKKLAEACQPSGKRKCCGALVCDRREGTTSTSCCKKLGASCVLGECCNVPTGSACVGGVCILI